MIWKKIEFCLLFSIAIDMQQHNLTHFGLVVTYGNIYWSQHWLRQWLFADGTKPLPELMLTYHQYDFVGPQDQFRAEHPRYQFVKWVLNMYLLNYIHIYKGPMSCMEGHKDRYSKHCFNPDPHEIVRVVLGILTIPIKEEKQSHGLTAFKMGISIHGKMACMAFKWSLDPCNE